MKFFMVFLLSFPAFAYRLNTSNGAAFGDSEIKFYVTSNSTCTNAGISASELLSIAQDAADKFWNRVPTSSIKLKRGGLFNTGDSLFLTGILCPEQSGSTCNASTSVPYTSRLLIACNNNTSDNFPSDDFIAISAPLRLASTKITSSIILINDTATSPFAGLSRAEKVSVLAHELGHAVGLGHSNRKEALMYYQNADKIMRLSQDDIDGISYLYPNEIDNCGGFLGVTQSGTQFPLQIMLGFGLILLSFRVISTPKSA